MTSPARVLVTGGASGIGGAVARLAAAAGADVVVLDRDVSAVDPAVARTVMVDVTDEAAVVAAVAEATDLLGTAPDGVVCAAGV
jgi:NAD(P)-dependent dehydrogenase (short-subunit alcohol dehydrogenase family)